MFNKTLIVATAASLIAAGSLAATATSASAAGPGHGPAHSQQFGGFHFSGPGWSIGFATPGYHPRHYGPQPVCRPIFKQVKWWKHGRLHTRLVKVGKKCRPQRRHPRRGWGPSAGWGPGWGPGW